MSGIFARRNYDNCFQTEILEQTTKPGKISLESSVARSNSTCYSSNSPYSNRVHNSGDLNITNYADAVSIENYLLNLDLPSSKCLDINALSEKDKRLKIEADKYKNIYNVVDCSDDISTKYSRLNNNINLIKEKPYNRYEFPLLNPSDFVYYGIDNTKQIGNNRAGVSTRIESKDSLSIEIDNLKKVLAK